jgi:hypothetical protein
MNRRRFVKALGISAISSTWVFAGEEILGKLNSASLTDAGISTVQGVAQAGGIWPRPVLVPLPKEVAGVPQPNIDLARTWKFTTSPPAEFWGSAFCGISLPLSAAVVDLEKPMGRFYRTFPALSQQDVPARIDAMSSAQRTSQRGEKSD